VGSQRSLDPESGEMFRLFLVLSLPNGQFVKLAGKVRADRQSGRLTASFVDNPQLPVSKIELRLKTGPSAPLATPPTGGIKTVATDLVSWGGQAVTSIDRFGIDGGFEGFGPVFSGGSVSTAGGGFSRFVAHVGRADRQEFVDAASFALPTGLTARLKGVALCSDGDAQAGSCGVESRVGSVRVGAGPGPAPFSLGGSVSLTGPYKGAPYGLAIAVPVVAGPFDLGTVVVRQAIFVDPVDAHITVVSDPLPTIVGGVPVRLRSIDVDIDRPGFVINPSSCATKQLHATLGSQQGTTTTLASRFQASDCGALGFKPRVSLKLSGKGQTREGGHPALRALVTQVRGQANIGRVEVRLPLSLALDPSNAGGLCEFAEGQKADPKCPASSVIGRAKAITPLLDRPLAGNVYFVKGVRKDPKSGRLIRTLPTLLVKLRGQVAINLRATTSVKHNQLVSTFAKVPDARVSRFELSLKGGKGGILVVTTNRNICKGKQTAATLLDGHNGKTSDTNTTIATPCHARTSARNAK
jgi:hypothetical protein